MSTAVATTLPGTMSGAELYERWQCVTCHQPDGRGSPGTFPPLAGSEYATAANVAVPIRVVLNGMHGPVTISGMQYNGTMPPSGIGIEMSDDQVAAVLTYVRGAWGNRASGVTAQDVARERATPRVVTGPVTVEELRALIGPQG